MDRETAERLVAAVEELATFTRAVINVTVTEPTRVLLTTEGMLGFSEGVRVPYTLLPWSTIQFPWEAEMHYKGLCYHALLSQAEYEALKSRMQAPVP